MEKNPERRAAREKEYESCIKRLGGSNEILAHLFAITTVALDENPNQDFLGKIYMDLNLEDHWKSQYFTPYDICSLMSEITVGSEAIAEAKTRDYISINDSACGAGAILIAAMNTFKQHHINYQQKVLFVGQDIDRVAAQMCYIQLSLLGCPGYVVVASTLTNPVTGPVLKPCEEKDQEFWYTPFYWTDIWEMRRMIQKEKYEKPEGEQMTIDEMMVERMANSFSMMDEEETQNWSRDAAADWVEDENLYAANHGIQPLPFDTEDVYDTIKAMIEAEKKGKTI